MDVFAMLALTAILATATMVSGLFYCSQAEADTSPWSLPIQVSAGLHGGWFPDIAADDFGNVHIVWNDGFPDLPTGKAGDLASDRSQMSLGNDKTPVPIVDQLAALWYSRLSGESWSKPNDIALIDKAYALRSSLAADRTGRVHLTYKGFGRLKPDRSYDPPRNLGPEDLWYTSAAGSQADVVASWLPAKRLSRSVQGYFCDLAVDRQGVIHAIWTEASRGIWGIYYSNSADHGVTWAERTALDDSGAVWWLRAQLEVDTQDRLHAVWEMEDTREMGSFGITAKAVYAQSTDGGKSWTRTEFQDSHSGLGPQQPAIGVDNQGNILFVFREPPETSRILFRQSSDGSHWSAPAPLPGIFAGCHRPYDVYDMVTDSSGHVHLAVVAMLGDANATTMSLVHLEWNGNSWGMPSIVANTPPFPEYPRLSISNGNRLHLAWFAGDDPSVNRNPIGIWYSTALTTAPETNTQALPSSSANEPSTSPITTPAPSPSSTPISTVLAGQPPRTDATSPDASHLWLSGLRQNPIYPLVITLVSVIPLLGVAMLAKSRLTRR